MRSLLPKSAPIYSTTIFPCLFAGKSVLNIAKRKKKPLVGDGLHEKVQATRANFGLSKQKPLLLRPCWGMMDGAHDAARHHNHIVVQPPTHVLSVHVHNVYKYYSSGRVNQMSACHPAEQKHFVSHSSCCPCPYHSPAS